MPLPFLLNDSIPSIAEAKPSTFIGRRHEVLKTNVAFGADQDPDFNDALFRHLALHERMASLIQRPDAKAGKMWLRVMSKHLKKLGREYPSQDHRYLHVERYHCHLLIGNESAVRLRHITTTSQHHIPLKRRPERWRYENLATIVWYQMAQNMRTREMNDPGDTVPAKFRNPVWKELMKLYQQYQIFLHRATPYQESSNRLDLASWYLALYERTVRLLVKEHRRDLTYQVAITHRESRQHTRLDSILDTPLHEYLDDEKSFVILHEEALKLRCELYHHLLLNIIANCQVGLLCL